MNIKTKTNSSFAVSYWKKQPSIFTAYLMNDICTIIELKELNCLCKHTKKVRSSQSCISMNFCTEWSSSMWVSLIWSPSNWKLLKLSKVYTSKQIIEKKLVLLTYFRFFRTWKLCITEVSYKGLWCNHWELNFYLLLYFWFFVSFFWGFSSLSIMSIFISDF